MTPAAILALRGHASNIRYSSQGFRLCSLANAPMRQCDTHTLWSIQGPRMRTYSHRMLNYAQRIGLAPSATTTHGGSRKDGLPPREEESGTLAKSAATMSVVVMCSNAGEVAPPHPK